MDINTLREDYSERSAPNDPDETRLDASSHDTPRPDATQAGISEPSNQASSPQLQHTMSQDAPSRDESYVNITERDASRPDAVVPDNSRQDAPNRGESRTNASGRDKASFDDMDELENWLDVEQVAERLRSRGVSRTIRTIQKMCKRGDLTARLVPTENGVRYIISDQSIDDFIKRHNEKLPTGGLGSEQHSTARTLNGSVRTDQTNELVQTPQMNDAQPAEAGKGVADHLREIIDIKNEQIAMLQSQVETANAQISVKDEQIATMHERDHETNILIQNLQGLVALPHGRSDAASKPQTSAPGAINVSHQPETGAH